MLIAVIFSWGLFIVTAALSGWLWAVLLRHMSVGVASGKAITLGLLLAGATVAIAVYSITGGLAFEMASHRPTAEWTMEVVGMLAPVWIGAFLLTRRSRR